MFTSDNFWKGVTKGDQFHIYYQWKGYKLLSVCSDTSAGEAVCMQIADRYQDLGVLVRCHLTGLQNTGRWNRYGRQEADNNYKYIFVNEKCPIFIIMSLAVVPGDTFDEFV